MAEQPKYRQVADTLRREIADGIFKDGQTLMTEEELRLRFDVSRQTVRQAIALLEDDGLVDRRRGSGTYVRHGSRRRTGNINIAVISTYFTAYIFPNILCGIESVLNEHGCLMTISATYNDPKKEREILKRMLQSDVDGLIIEGVKTAEASLNMDLYHQFAERNIPVLFMNGHHESLTNIPFVAMDDYAGGRQAARELVRRGYRSLAGIFKTDDLQGQKREQGFMDELAVYGLQVAPEAILHFNTENRHHLFETAKGKHFLDLLSEKGRIDGLCTFNDVYAIRTLLPLRQRGVVFPQDMGIISFDDSAYATMDPLGLTTFAHPKEEFGRVAAHKLLNMINGEKEKSVSLPWNLVERGSLPSVNIK